MKKPTAKNDMTPAWETYPNFALDGAAIVEDDQREFAGLFGDPEEALWFWIVPFEPWEKQPTAAQIKQWDFEQRYFYSDHH
jgi:hypothetical protein